MQNIFREMAIKFNDYFEFPREFDMAPYTAAALAKAEGERPRVFLINRGSSLNISLYV